MIRQLPSPREQDVDELVQVVDVEVAVAVMAVEAITESSRSLYSCFIINCEKLNIVVQITHGCCHALSSTSSSS